jgi:putative toxin-antitoxin system antitoxin component (TIGR02293 family)
MEQKPDNPFYPPPPAEPFVTSVAGAPVSWPVVEAAIVSGLPRAALDQVAAAICPEPAEATKLIHRVVPKSSLNRRGTLTQAQGEQTERLARLFAYATRVFGGAEDARIFMRRPHPELGGRRPLDAALTELGGRAVERILDSLAFGLPV